MKVLKSLAVLTIVIIIGFVVYFKVYKSEEARKARLETEQKLVRFDLDAIDSFTLVRPDSSVVFKRGVGRIWNITSPVETEADKEPIYKLFNALHESDILYTIDENPDDLAQYGLEAPRYYMAMRYTKGGSDSLFVGDNTPDGTMAYVKFSSENRVLAVSNQLTNQLKLPVNSYRARTVLNVLQSDITSLEIDRKTDDGGREILQFAIENGVWWMQTPWHHPAHKQNLTEVIASLVESQRKFLIDEQPDDLEQYGLHDPSKIITVTLKYNMPNKILLIGNEEPSRTLGRFYYGKKIPEDLVFGTGTGLIRLLDRHTSWFIDNQPLKFPRNVIDRIELNANNEKFVFMLDNTGNWNIISPVDRNVPRDTVDTIFAISRFIQALELVAYEPTEDDLVRTGLDDPRISISFYSNNQTVNHIYFGNSFTTDRQNTYFRTDVSPIIYTTGASIDTRLNTILQSVYGS